MLKSLKRSTFAVFALLILTAQSASADLLFTNWNTAIVGGNLWTAGGPCSFASCFAIGDNFSNPEVWIVSDITVYVVTGYPEVASGGGWRYALFTAAGDQVVAPTDTAVAFTYLGNYFNSYDIYKGVISGLSINLAPGEYQFRFTNTQIQAIYPAYGSSTSAQTLSPGFIQLTGSPEVEALLSTTVDQRSEEWAFEVSGSLVHNFIVDTTGDYSDNSPGDGTCLDSVAIAGNADAPTAVSCSLRAAIQEANALGGIASITFSPGLDGTPITLDSQLPAVTAALTITGNGAAATIVQASTCDPVALPGGCTPATWRVFEVGAAGNLGLGGLTIRHGNATGGNDGGGILNAGTLSLSSVTTSANVAGNNGGGLENAGGTVTAILDSAFTGNQSGNNGGGVDNCCNSGTISEIMGSHFSGNHAPYGAGFYAGITGSITNTTFVGNVATNYGGGIYADGDLTLVKGCTFDGNSSGDQGGGFYTDSADAVGLITQSLFTGNSSAKGGGLREFDGSMGAITNSTFSGNTATAEGGAIETKSGTITGIVNVTITGNTSPLGAGIYTESNIPISNSIFGDNGGGGSNCEGTFTDLGGNFSDDTSCNSAGSIVPGTDYSLTLADNGGPTKTHALIAGSPAIDADGACPSELHGVDQRGAPRDDNCDSGAYEYNLIFADGFEGK